MKILILRGLPASGKSTWAKQYCEKNIDWIRVNRDDLRRMRGKYWIPKQEKLITQLEWNCIKTSLINGYNVIVDSTNLNPKYYNNLNKKIKNLTSIKQINIDIETKFFDITLKDAIERDLKRQNSVGEKVIKDIYKKYLRPKYDPIKKQDISKKPSIICDLDGTLCIFNGRKPYEYHKCDTDLINNPISEIVKKFLLSGGWKIIYLSGREDICKYKSLQWLKSHNLWIDSRCELMMRKQGDYRDDTIIKQEIFKYDIAPFYYVDFILDDRNKVVEMWRELGLTCLQVAEGDF